MPGDHRDWSPGFLHWQLVGGDSRSAWGRIRWWSIHRDVIIGNHAVLGLPERGYENDFLQAALNQTP